MPPECRYQRHCRLTIVHKFQLALSSRRPPDVSRMVQSVRRRNVVVPTSYD